MNLQRLLPERMLKTGKCQIDDELGCIIWTGGTTGDGYGAINIAGKNTSTHIFSFYSYHNFYPEVVSHSCDNPLCVNPLHLFASTQVLNQQDKVRKGRQAKGEHNGKAKLTEQEAKEALALRKKGVLYKDIAVCFGVHKDTIRKLCNGNNWKHLKDTDNE